ncbi:MAG: hypothetical protein AVDCRST_MAG07-2734, partial [uncultured Frankineae bacterium]
DGGGARLPWRHACVRLPLPHLRRPVRGTAGAARVPRRADLLPVRAPRDDPGLHARRRGRRSCRARSGRRRRRLLRRGLLRL